MEAIQKLNVPSKLNESLNINLDSNGSNGSIGSNGSNGFNSSNNSDNNTFKKWAIYLILIIFALFLLRYVLNFTLLGQNIKNSITTFFYDIEIGGKKVFNQVNKVQNQKKKFIKKSKNTLQEIENAVNKNIRKVSKNLKNKNLVNKQMLLNKKQKQKQKQKQMSQPKPERITRKQILEDDSSNPIQSRSKTGYCFVGNDRGYRSCMEIDELDKCVSNKIFPTRELCINPTLRV